MVSRLLSSDMIYENHACLIFMASFLMACGGAAQNKDDSASTDRAGVCGDPNDTQAFVVTSMSFTRERSDGVIAGFDLDGVDSAAGDAEGCGHADYSSPDGLGGIDNAFAPLVDVLESLGAGAVEGLIEDAINSGELLLLLELEAVDDVRDDTCVDMGVYRGQGIPLLDTNGDIQMDQTIAFDPEQPSSFAQGGQISDGTFEIIGVEVFLPVQILDEFFEFDMIGGGVRLVWQEDGTVAGELAGGVAVSAIAGQIGAIDDIGGLQDVVPPLLEQAADLWPDESGACTHISIGFDITARPAFVAR